MPDTWLQQNDKFHGILEKCQIPESQNCGDHRAPIGMNRTIFTTQNSWFQLSADSGRHHFFDLCSIYLLKVNYPIVKARNRFWSMILWQELNSIANSAPAEMWNTQGPVYRHLDTIYVHPYVLSYKYTSWWLYQLLLSFLQVNFLIFIRVICIIISKLQANLMCKTDTKCR